MNIQSSISTWQQFAAGHGSRSVTLVLDEGKASVLGLVGGTRVHNDIHDPFGDLPHLRQDLLTLLRFGNPSHKQTAVVDTGTDTEEAAIPTVMRNSLNILDECRTRQVVEEFETLVQDVNANEPNPDLIS